MKWFIFSLSMILVGVGIIVFDYRYEAVRLQAESHKDALVKENYLVNEIYKTISDKDYFAILQTKTANLSEDNRKKLEPLLQLATAVAIFEEGEGHLSKAIELNNALREPPAPAVLDKDGKPLPPPPPPPPHPLVVKSLKSAFKNYKEAKELCDRMQDISGNNDFNFSLNYFKGEVYYRHTQFLSTPETVKELFDQTLVCWKHALHHKPRDIDTVINIELLIKNQSQMLSDAVQPSTNRPQMLPVKQAGRGKLKGI